jgi:gliding motility-associated-like protein
MANAFSPGSESNPVFKVSHLGTASLRSFRIYDRWGVKVFETSNINEGWDGTFNGAPQPLGVYVYTVEAQTNLGKPFIKQGNVTLLR